MTNLSSISLPQAARTLGVSVRVLRRAIRAGKVPLPPQLGALAALSPEWLASVELAAVASPKLFSSVARQKVPPFARYEGTSAWRKYRNRVREFYRHHEATSA